MKSNSAECTTSGRSMQSVPFDGGSAWINGGRQSSTGKRITCPIDALRKYRSYGDQDVSWVSLHYRALIQRERALVDDLSRARALMGAGTG
jgi:hypothetical protein